jgi:hypothetical protein
MRTAAFLMIVTAAATCPAWGQYPVPHGRAAGAAEAGGGTRVSDFCAHLDRKAEGLVTPPYKSTSLLYGYQDFVYGRGPLVDLGSRTLLPGFRGYGLLCSPGYGAGLRPTSAIDLDHFNGGPWYHKFPDHFHFPRWLNRDPGTPGRRL